MACVVDADAEQAEIYRRAGADPYDPPGGLRLVRMLLGADAVVFAPGLRNAAQYRPESRRIFARPSLLLAPRALNFLLSHEAAEWHLHAINYDGGDIEQLADQIAARIAAPHCAVRAALHGMPATPEAIAGWFCVSETVGALRLGEVTARPVAVVDPAWIAVRGAEWGWPPERLLRLLARGAERVPQIERVPLNDSARRVCLVAD